MPDAAGVEVADAAVPDAEVPDVAGEVAGAAGSPGWVARQAGSSGRAGAQAAARGDPALFPVEEAVSAPVEAAACRSQQECTSYRSQPR
ncbi:hypothetical protein HLY00_1120 [Mycolicibacterium hippocampi]|uniref:Uncharacterized protein n=1 Tax=Mycolicibacterium hippocampi TaxID=659824 RepID=A0A850PRI7_9MYCO|nr:hypothetical protein [Mycolicibacterium hippocampi]